MSAILRIFNKLNTRFFEKKKIEKLEKVIIDKNKNNKNQSPVIHAIKNYRKLSIIQKTIDIIDSPKSSIVSIIRTMDISPNTSLNSKILYPDI